MCSKAFIDIDEKHGAESDVLSELLGICTVELFFGSLGYFFSSGRSFSDHTDGDLARYFWSRSKVVKIHTGDLNHAEETI